MRRTLALFVLLAALLAGGAALLLTAPGRHLLAQGLGWLASSPGLTVEIHGLGPGLPGTIRIAHLALADAQGPWLSAQDIEIRWQWQALFSGTIVSPRAIASHVAVHRLPQPHGNENEPSPSLPLGFHLQAIQIDEITFAPAIAHTQLRAHLQGQFHLTATAWDVACTMQELPSGMGINASAAGDSHQLRLTVQLTTPGSGWLHHALGLGSLPVSMTLSGEGPWERWFGAVEIELADLLQGKALMQGTGSQLHLTGTFQGGPLVPAAAQEPTQIDALLQWKEAGLAVPQLQLLHRLAMLTASGHVNQSGHGTWIAALAAPLSPNEMASWNGTLTHDLQGLTAAGTLQLLTQEGSLDAPGKITLAWNGAWESAFDLTLSHSRLSAPLATHLVVAGSALRPQGSLSLASHAPPPLPEPLPRLLGPAPRLEAQWRVEGATLILDPLHLEAPLTAYGKLTANATTIAAALRLRLAPRVWDLAPAGAEGQLQGDWRAQQLQAELRLPQLILAGIPLEKVMATGAWQGTTATATAAAQAQGLALQLEAHGSVTPTEFQLRRAELKAGAARCTASGSLRRDKSAGSATLRLQAPEVAAFAPLLGHGLGGNMDANATLAQDRRGWRASLEAHGQLTGPTWSSGMANLRATLSPQRQEWNFTAHRPRLGSWPLGRVSLELAGPAAALDGTLAATGDQGQITAQLRLTDQHRLSVTGLTGTLLNFPLRQGDPLQLRWEAPFLIWAPWQLALGPVRLTTEGRWGPAIAASFRLQGNLHPLVALAGLAGQRLEGEIDAHLHLQGSSSAPQMTGQGQISALRYTHVGLGLIVEEGRATLLPVSHWQGLRAVASGQDPLGGKVELEGEWRFPLEGRLTAQFHRFRLAHTDRLHVIASGPMQLHLKNSPHLSADLALSGLFLRLPRQLSAIPRVEVEEIPSPATRPGPLLPALSLDVRLHTEEPARLIGHGLDSLWQATITARGPATAPTLEGELTLERGTWQFLGRRFVLTQGQIAFPEPGRSFVDLTAQATAPGIQTTARLLGPMDALRLDLASTPPLPTEEILARTLFGRSMRQIAPFQALRLAQAAASLGASRTANGLTDLTRLDALEERLGLQGFSLGMDEQDNPALQLDGEIGGTQVRAERSLGSGDRTSIEVQITPNLGVRTEIGADSRQGAGIQWSLDY